MIKFIFIILTGLIFTQAEKDTTMKLPRFDLEKGFNIPGLVPKTFDMLNKKYLAQHEMKQIKQKAKDFEPKPVTEDDIVIMETTRGVIKLKLFPDKAPNHCKNFKKLANSGFYDGTTFHRIIPGFMIQGGDLNSRDNDPNNDGHGGPGWTVDAEFNGTDHKRGILSMARSSDPNSAGSQFFICVADASHLNGDYTVFGEVVENIHVIDHIVNTPTEYNHAKKACREKIPEGEDPEQYITLRDSKTRKKLYAKIPKQMRKAEYEFDMRRKIKSDKPVSIVEMNKVRVVSSVELNDGSTGN